MGFYDEDYVFDRNRDIIDVEFFVLFKWFKTLTIQNLSVRFKSNKTVLKFIIFCVISINSLNAKHTLYRMCVCCCFETVYFSMITL